VQVPTPQLALSPTYFSHHPSIIGILFSQHLIKPSHPQTLALIRAAWSTGYMATMANAFPFGHDHQYDWRQHNAVPGNAHHPAQQHAAAQHFGRLPAMNNGGSNNTQGMGGITSNDHQPSLLGSQDPQQQEDNRRTLDWIAQLLNPSTRETALLELSKKREQVPELALVLWHSFGTLPASQC
jgi:hypothetical protein